MNIDQPTDDYSLFVMPQRKLLVVQAADCIRAAIKNGEWKDFLPGEIDLCSYLGVSRTTLRSAIKQLEREGLISSSQGQRRKILFQAKHKLHSSNKMVILLSPVPLHQAPQQAIYWVDELREHLRKAGFSLEVLARPSCYHQQPETFLNELSHRHHPIAWVLYRSTAKMQQWFSEHKLPCVIAGSRHIEKELVSVDIDHRALCLHAAGLLLARGYENIYLIIPNSGLAGDIESEKGFLEGAEKYGKGKCKSGVLRHNGTFEGVVNCLEKIFPSGIPVGLLVANQYHSLTALCWLMQNKLRVPSDVGIISRDNDVFYDYVIPKMTRYMVNPTVFADKIARMALKCASGELISSRDCRVMPKLIQGHTTK